MSSDARPVDDTASMTSDHFPRPARRLLLIEIALLLTVTFGMSGLRSTLRLISALLDPTPLNEQVTSLNASQSAIPWLDLGLQLASAAALTSWGGLALFVLYVHQRPASIPIARRGRLGSRAVASASKPQTGVVPFRIPAPAELGGRGGARTWVQGAALAALIGIPGLALYVAAIHLGWSKQVIPAPLEHLWFSVPVLVIWSFANAFAEEIVVVFWLATRMRQLGSSSIVIVIASSLLRGSYHLYQGVSAGFGNIAMGVVFSYFFLRTGKVWPLVVAHFLIDAVAFVGYQALGGNLGWLGL